MGCTLCKMQYVRKEETPFNIRVNNHRKDANGNNPGNNNGNYSCSHIFQTTWSQLQKSAKFTLIKQINNTINTDTIRIRLERRECFWILKLDTLNTEWVKSRTQQRSSSDLLYILCLFQNIIYQLLQQEMKHLRRKY